MFEVLIDRICAASRAEASAAGQRLVAVGQLFAARLRDHDERAGEWAADTTDAVSAEVAAALSISQALASSYVHYARALREQLPAVGAALVAGDIDYSTFQAVVFRTGLITDDDVLAAVDAELAEALPRWPAMSRRRLRGRIDTVVARHDRDAVRRRVRDRLDEREVWISEPDAGVSTIHATVYGVVGAALEQRLGALIATVCTHDPRTVQQRRSDALGALAANSDRLGCLCGREDCAAGGAVASAPVLIHVLADAATVEGTGERPGSTVEADGLIPPEVIAELAKSARHRPLVHPADCPAEAGYTPSRKLADFVRCRDLTCRFPGCDRPAVRCDLDHTVPYADGGPTHASNLKCLCRLHHLIKTFWGWRDQQLRDGTVVWTSPSGQTYVTTAGSALSFTDLCAPTAAITPPDTVETRRSAGREAMMPRRTRTRAQNTAARIAAERRANRNERTARCIFGTYPIRAGTDASREPPDPPPF